MMIRILFNFYSEHGAQAPILETPRQHTFPYLNLSLKDLTRSAIQSREGDSAVQAGGI